MSNIKLTGVGDLKKQVLVAALAAGILALGGCGSSASEQDSAMLTEDQMSPEQLEDAANAAQEPAEQVATSVSSEDVQALKFHGNCYAAQNILVNYRADWLDDAQRSAIESSRASHQAAGNAIMEKYQVAVSNGNEQIASQLRQASQDLLDRYEAELNGTTEAGRSELGNQIAGRAKDEIASYGQSAECST